MSTALRSVSGSSCAGAIGSVLRYTQTLTLWRGVPRVDCSTTIDEFTGEDKLLRLRWPCPVPGAMPVSEVGDAVVGRGFALLHEPGSASPSTPRSTPTHWTIRPTAGSGCPRRCGCGSTSRTRGAQESSGRRSTSSDGVRAVSVAEVISPSEAESAPLARDLMVALVRAGVTATCSSADRSRYGNLDVDSNLPDARIALGGPDENAFTAEVLAEADPAYAEELKRQLYASGSARVWVPAAAPLASSWLPDADLRGVRVLPVLIVAGSDGLDAAVAAIVDDLGDAEISVSQQVPSDIEPVRGPDRRGAQPRRAQLRRRHRRHPAHVADAVVHRMAVRRVDGSAAAPHRTRRLELPASALDPHLRLRTGHRRRGLAIGRCSHRSAEFSHPLLAVVEKAAPQADCPVGARFWRSSPPVPSTSPR